MPTITDRSSVPPEGWQYPAIAGPNIKSSAYANLYSFVARHYRANGQEPPTREAVDLWVCANLRVRCAEGREPYRNKFTDPPTFLSRGLPSPAWPLLLRPFKLLAQDGDRGLGDIIYRTIGPANSDAFKTWYRGVFGRNCGCDERQNALNEEFPL